jgi:hypothetical protein
MATKFNEFVNSIIRTGTAVFVGGIITYLVARGLNLNESLKTPSTEVLFGITSVGYYAVVRVLEHFVNERFGWLLMSSGNPTYPSVTWIEQKEKKRFVRRPHASAVSRAHGEE